MQGRVSNHNASKGLHKSPKDIDPHLPERVHPGDTRCMDQLCNTLRAILLADAVSTHIG